MGSFNLRRRRTKQAVHGRGDGWTEVGPGGIPGYSSPTMNWAPQFGGRWRENFPGGGSQHINDDSDKQKSLRGNSDDADPSGKRDKINDKMRVRMVDGDDGSYIITYRCKDEENPEEMAKQFGDDFGVEARSSGASVIILVDGGFDEAASLQRKMPGTVLEKRKEST